MTLWRIATKTRSYSATDLSRAGAALYPGRWNELQQPVVYCSPSIAIAVLETAAHINDAGLPMNHFLVEIEVPTEVWKLHEVVKLPSLPKTWATIPAGSPSAKFGSKWLTSLRSSILRGLSVIAPEEFATLINPLHPESSKITAKVIRPFEYNKLFRAGQGRANTSRFNHG